MVEINVRAQRPATNDLWNYDRGMFITRCEMLDGPSTIGAYSNPYDMFGADLGIFSSERGGVVFRNEPIRGYIHCVEWRTLTPVVVRSIRLFGHGDPDPVGQREFAAFTLKAKPLGSTDFTLILCYFVPSHPYNLTHGGGHPLILETNLTPVVSQEFRAEFLQSDMVATPGPRIHELDAFGDSLPNMVETNTIISIAPAVEVSWQATPGNQYQVQWAPDFSTNQWFNLGLPQLATNEFLRLYEPVADHSARFYRVLTLGD